MGFLVFVLVAIVIVVILHYVDVKGFYWVRVINNYKLDCELKKYQKHELYRHFVDFCILNGYNYIRFRAIEKGTVYFGHVEGRGLFYEKEIKLHDFNVLINKYGFESVTIPPASTIHEYISIVNMPYYGNSYEGDKYFCHFYSLKVSEGTEILTRSFEHYIDMSWGVSLTDDTIIDELFMEKHKDSLIQSIGIFTKCELPYWKASSLVNKVIEDMYSGKAKEDSSGWDTSYFTESFLDKYANKYRDIRDFFYHEILINIIGLDRKIPQSEIEVSTKGKYLDYCEDRLANSINEHAKSIVSLDVNYQQTCWGKNAFIISLLYHDDKWLVDNINSQTH